MGEQPQLLRRDVQQPGLPGQPGHPADRGQQQRHGRPAEPAGALGEQQDALPGHVEGPGVDGARLGLGGGPAEHRDGVVLVHELEPGVVAEDGRQHGQREVLAERGVRAGADDVGEAQDRHRDVRAAPGEAADVALDLRRVLGEAAAGRVLRLDPLGEHRRVAGRGAVDAGGRLHHQPAHPGRLLAGAEQLHGADDVGLLHRGAVGGAQAGGADAEVDHGVDPVLGDHPGDRRAAQVELVEAVLGGRSLRLLDRQPGRLHVHADHQVHTRTTADLGGEAGTEMACHAGDEHDHAHGVHPIPSARAACVHRTVPPCRAVKRHRPPRPRPGRAVEAPGALSAAGGAYFLLRR